MSQAKAPSPSSGRLEPADHLAEHLDAAPGEIRARRDHLFAVALVLAAQGKAFSRAILADRPDRAVVDFRRVQPVALDCRAARIEPYPRAALDRGLHFVADH